MNCAICGTEMIGDGGSTVRCPVEEFHNKRMFGTPKPTMNQPEETKLLPKDIESWRKAAALEIVDGLCVGLKPIEVHFKTHIAWVEKILSHHFNESKPFNPICAHHTDDERAILRNGACPLCTIDEENKELLEDKAMLDWLDVGSNLQNFYKVAASFRTQWDLRAAISNAMKDEN